MMVFSCDKYHPLSILHLQIFLVLSYPVSVSARSSRGGGGVKTSKRGECERWQLHGTTEGNRGYVASPLKGGYAERFLPQKHICELDGNFVQYTIHGTTFELEYVLGD